MNKQGYGLVNKRDMETWPWTMLRP